MSRRKQSYISEYHKLAKKADARLRALENLANKNKSFAGIKHMAYAKAQRDIKTWSGEGRTRFDTKPPRTIAGIRAKIADIKSFLESPSSTYTGLRKVYMKTSDTLKQRYGVDLTPEQMKVLFDTGMFDKLRGRFGSAVALEAIGVVQKNQRSIKNMVRGASTKKYVDDPILNKEVQGMLRGYKKDLKKLGIDV